MASARIGDSGGGVSSAWPARLQSRLHPKATVVHDAFERRGRMAAVGMGGKGFRATSGAGLAGRAEARPAISSPGGKTASKRAGSAEPAADARQQGATGAAGARRAGGGSNPGDYRFTGGAVRVGAPARAPRDPEESG